MSFDAFLGRIGSTALRDIAAHWRAVRGTRRMPAWKDIDAVALAPHLSKIWAWKYDAASDSFTGRLAGEGITAIFGKSLRGVPMREFFAAPTYDLIFERHKRVVAGPCFMHGRGPVFLHVGRCGMGERIILPLSEDGARADGIIGGTVYQLTSREASAEHPGMIASAEEVTFFPLD